MKAMQEKRIMGGDWRARALTLALVLGAPLSAMAQAVIQSISSSQQAGTEVVRIELSEPLSAIPKGFVVQSPPRIAIDLPGVGNAMGKPTVDINQGNLRTVNVAQSDDRTRVVLNLRQSSTYRAELQGKVLAIDKANREVTVKGGSGIESTLYVGPDVKNFERLKVGDIVTLNYVAALGLELKKNGKALRERIESEQKDGLQGKQPGMMYGKTVKIIADVMAVNLDKGSLTLRGPKRTVDLVLQDPSLLKEVKVGDQIEVSYMEATVISAKSGMPAKAGAAK